MQILLPLFALVIFVLPQDLSRFPLGLAEEVDMLECRPPALPLPA